MKTNLMNFNYIETRMTVRNFLVGRNFIVPFLLAPNLSLERYKFRDFSTSSCWRRDFNHENLDNLNLKQLNVSIGDTHIFKDFFGDLPSIQIPTDNSYSAMEAWEDSMSGNFVNQDFYDYLYKTFIWDYHFNLKDDGLVADVDFNYVAFIFSKSECEFRFDLYNDNKNKLDFLIDNDNVLYIKFIRFNNIEVLIEYFVDAYILGEFDDLRNYLSGLCSDIGNDILDIIEKRNEFIDDIYFNVVYIEGLLETVSDVPVSEESVSDGTVYHNKNLQEKFINLNCGIGKRFYHTNIHNNTYLGNRNCLQYSTKKTLILSYNNLKRNRSLYNLNKYFSTVSYKKNILTEYRIIKNIITTPDLTLLEGSLFGNNRIYSTNAPSTKINKWVDYQIFVDYDLDSFKRILFSDNKVKFNCYYALLTKVRKENKFYGLATKQLGVCFSSLDDEAIQEVFETIGDRLEVFFEEYRSHLEYSCDSVLLEFHPVKEVDGVVYKIANKREAKLKISKESYRLGISAFNILGGFDLKKTAYPVIIKRKFSTTTQKINNSQLVEDKLINMIGFTSDVTELVKFEEKFNSNFLKSNIKHKDIYKFFEGSEIFITHKNSRPYVIIVDKKDNEIHKRVYNKYANIISYVIDIKMENGGWKRRQRNSTTVFNDNNEILLSEKDIKFLPIQDRHLTKKKDTVIANPNIGVIDIETTSDEKPRCYCLGFYTNIDKKPQTFYIGEDLNSTQLVHSCINEMMRYKYRNTTFYAHNAGKFDAVFILKELMNFNNTPEGKQNPYIIPEPVTRNSDILKLVIKRKFDNKTGVVTILDSYSMLSRSLRDLCADYKIKISKSFFPYEFTISDNLFYIGNTPNINYYVDIPEEVYKDLVKQDWDLKNESLKYLELDLQSLYEVLVLINKTSNLLFDIDLTESTTVSSLANKIYLKKYYDVINKPIPLIKDPIVFEDLHKAYYGGRVEVFNPIIPKDKKVFCYDVNSLYPSASLNDMPGLNCVYFENVKEKIELQNLFGFVYCNVKCSKDLYFGLLPKRTDTSLIFPKGEWSGWYFTEELKLAALNGYEVEILKGYRFDRVPHVFDNFVNDIYKIKSNPRNDSEKNVAKLILNSLIGRFGMSIEKSKTTIIPETKHLELLTTRVFKNSIDLGGVYIDTYLPTVDKEVCNIFSKDYNKTLSNENLDEKGVNPINNVSITTAAAVLSYARIHMAKIMLYVLENKGTLYYTDTDSIVTDLELAEHFIDPVELGKLKLEHIIKEGFL